MRIRELFATQLAAFEAPARFAPGDGLSAFELTESRVEALRECVLGLLFPEESSADVFRELARGDSFETGMVLKVGGKHDLRLRRSIGPESVRLQVRGSDGRFETRASGAAAVHNALQTSLGLRPFEVAAALHLGRLAAELPAPALALGGGPAPVEDEEFPSWFEPSARNLRPADLFGDAESAPAPDPLAAHERAPLMGMDLSAPPARSADEIERMRLEYAKAERAEALDEQITQLRLQLKALENTPRDREVERELERVRQELLQVAEIEISDADLETLKDPERRIQDIERRKEGLQSRIETARSEGEGIKQLLKNPVFVPGTVLALVCTLASILGGPNLRAIALGNVVCLAGTLFGVLQYLRAKEDKLAQRRDLMTLDHGLADITDERRAYEQQLGQVRRRHRVQTYEELRQKVSEREALRAKEQELAEQVKTHKRLSAEESEAERQRLEFEVDRLVFQREQLGEAPLASFQIAQELSRLGVDVRAQGGAPAARRPQTTPSGPAKAAPSQPVRYPGAWMLAESLGLIEQRGLERSVREVWGKLLSAFLGRAAEAPELAPDGTIRTGPGMPALDDPRARPALLAVDTLCLSLLVRAIGRSQPSPWPLVLRFDPFASLTTADADRLRQVYGRLSQHVQIVVFDSGIRAD